MNCVFMLLLSQAYYHADIFFLKFFKKIIRSINFMELHTSKKYSLSSRQMITQIFWKFLWHKERINYVEGHCQAGVCFGDAGVENGFWQRICESLTCKLPFQNCKYLYPFVKEKLDEHSTFLAIQQIQINKPRFSQHVWRM